MQVPPRTYPQYSRILALAAFVLFLLAALSALGVPSSWRTWEIPGGLAALALAAVLG